MLIDSDVLEWLTRGHPGAAARLVREPVWHISAVTCIEFKSIDGLIIERFDAGQEA